ncbi:hypothetical protein C8R46DRAFT_283528 [Mycena filopes]|nr:hypothetical protein C8R46DRAFT_283528 [Mycena filopes]
MQMQIRSRAATMGGDGNEARRHCSPVPASPQHGSDKHHRNRKLAPPSASSAQSRHDTRGPRTSLCFLAHLRLYIVSILYIILLAKRARKYKCPRTALKLNSTLFASSSLAPVDASLTPTCCNFLAGRVHALQGRAPTSRTVGPGSTRVLWRRRPRLVDSAGTSSTYRRGYIISSHHRAAEWVWVRSGRWMRMPMQALDPRGTRIQIRPNCWERGKERRDAWGVILAELVWVVDRERDTILKIKSYSSICIAFLLMYRSARVLFIHEIQS